MLVSGIVLLTMIGITIDQLLGRNVMEIDIECGLEVILSGNVMEIRLVRLLLLGREAVNDYLLGVIIELTPTSSFWPNGTIFGQQAPEGEGN